MIFDQSFTFVNFSELGYFALVAIILAVSFASERFTNRLSQSLDIFGIPLNYQRAAFGVDSVCDGDEEKHLLVRLHSSEESVRKIDVNTIASVQ